MYLMPTFTQTKPFYKTNSDYFVIILQWIIEIKLKLSHNTKITDIEQNRFMLLIIVKSNRESISLRFQK